MTFSYDGVRLFLTYSQSGELTKEQVIAHLQTLRPLKWLRICYENHQDGNRHIHCCGEFERRFKSSNERIFDVGGIHPNVRFRQFRWPGGAIAYVTKDGEFTDVGTIPTVGSAKRSVSEAWALAGTGNEVEYLVACQEAGISYQYAKRVRELTFQDISNTINELYEACLEWERQDLQEQALPENSCAVLVGPAGIGKTCWAKRVAPKPALWVSHVDVLRLFRPGYHKSIIFDDMVFHHWPVQSQIHILDWTDSRQIHCRYGYATIPAKTIKIFTCNEFPFTNGNAAINRRMTLINL